MTSGGSTQGRSNAPSGRSRGAHEPEQTDQRIGALPKGHGPLPDQRETRGAPGLVDPLALTIGQGKTHAKNPPGARCRDAVRQ